MLNSNVITYKVKKLITQTRMAILPKKAWNLIIFENFLIILKNTWNFEQKSWKNLEFLRSCNINF